MQGIVIDAQKNISLNAEGDIALLAARNDREQHSSQQSSSSSVGVGYTMGGASNGFGVMASIANSQMNGDGSETAYTNSVIKAEQRIEINSGGDTSLVGAVAQANQISANIGGNLTIQSLQNQSTYDESGSSTGGSMFIGSGTSNASASYSQTTIESDYRSVAQQSGFRAGDGGFQVNVKGNTDLIGGAITSTDKAVDGGINTFQTASLTLRDLENKASYSAESFSVGVGSSSSAGYGRASDRDSSTTQSAISGIAGNQAARTGDKETGIANNFDLADVQAELGAQVAITRAFGQNASKAVGNYATTKYNELKDSDPEEAAKWAEGGLYRVALHAVVGGLTGGTQGALGSTAGSTAAPLLDQLQDQLQAGLEGAGLSPEAAKKLAGLATGAAAATVGSAAGGSAGAVTAFNADLNNRQLHPTEAKLIKENARRYAEQRYGTSDPSPEQILAAQIELANTAQNIVDNNMDGTVPNFRQAYDFLQQIKIDYFQTNGTLDIAGTSGQPGGVQQLFYASVEQMNMPWLNRGEADPSVTNLIVKTPINPPNPGETGASGRDRLTGLPLDENGRYSQTVTVGDKQYQPKYFPCGSHACANSGTANLDMSDPGTQAYVAALDAQIFRDIGKGATYGSLVTPVGAPAALLQVVGLLASAGEVATSDTPTDATIDEAIKFVSEKGGESAFKNILGHSPASSARIVALIDLSGGWDAFTERVRIDLLRMRKSEQKN